MSDFVDSKENNAFIIVLKSEILTVKEIKKKSTAKMFGSLIVGDNIQFMIELERVGWRASGTYAPFITALNLKTGEHVDRSFNQMATVIKPFVFEKLTMVGNDSF